MIDKKRRTIRYAFFVRKKACYPAGLNFYSLLFGFVA